VHVCGSTLIWILALRLMFALRDRGALAAATGPEAPAALAPEAAPGTPAGLRR
jgi:hypothetical protein